MAQFSVFTPGTNVQITPIQVAGCDNSIGVIISSCLKKCCDQTNTWCESYTVQYEFKACTSCQIVESEFCRSELIELP